MREYNADKWTLESVLAKAMDDEGLTLGEVIAMLLLARGEIPFNNHPGVFKDLEPIKE